ncbi:MAG: serine/threonine-protein kinase, partial [Planctomycetota bacterium]
MDHLSTSKAGQRFGPYELIRELGRGGMGAVYLAKHRKLNRLVALKFIKTGGRSDGDVLARFEREMLAIGQVQHPNVVVAHDAGQIDETHFIAMEFVDGETLAKRQQTEGTLSVNDACEFIRQAALGLHHAHQRGLVHRDIKPSNLMIDKHGVVKVLDLGLARLDPSSNQGLSDSINSPSELTQAGTAMGTVGYMSPEQVMDSGSIDARSDIYSLGVTLFRALSGRMPFAEEIYQNFARFAVAIHRDEPTAIDQLCPNIPPELVALLQAMLARDPKMRIQTAAEVAERLNVIQSSQHEAESERTTQLVEPTSDRSIRSLRWTLTLVPIGLLAIGFALAQVFLISTPTGQLLVEVADEQAAARLTSEGLVVIDGKNDRSWNIKTIDGEAQPFPAGNYRFEAPAGLLITDDSGLEIRSNELKLLDQDDQLRIRVSILPSPNLTNGLEQASEGSESSQRYQSPGSLFDMVDNVGGRISFLPTEGSNGKWSVATSQQELNAELALLRLDFVGCSEFGDSEMGRVAESLKTMSLGRCNLIILLRGTLVSELGLLHLNGLKISSLDTNSLQLDLAS